MQKLTNEIVDLKLIDRNIKRLDNYIDSGKLINFRCLLCDYIWKTTPNSLLHGRKTGCPYCSNRLILTNEIIDKKLSNRSIKRLDDYINSKVKINFQCLIDDYIWPATPNNILVKKSGCPMCYGNITLTNEIIDQRLTNRDIKRLGNYINSKTRIDFQCLKENCNYVWQTTISSVIYGNSDCPNCSYCKNERIIYDVLIANNVDVTRHKQIKEIIANETRKLIVDFYVNNLIIEYNGRQHYEPVCFGGISLERANDNFEKQQERDEYLQVICDKNNIKLIWIDGRKYVGTELKKYIADILD